MPLLCPIVSLSDLLLRLALLDGVRGRGLLDIDLLRLGPRGLTSPLRPSAEEIDEDVEVSERVFRGRPPRD
jgi:hypothetical protein